MNIEKEIQKKGLTAPRVTMNDIEDQIEETYFFTVADGIVGNFEIDDALDSHLRIFDTITFCVIILKNGFVVTGESAPASPENFDKEMGRRIAEQRAKEKIWPLLGYELKTKILNGEV